MFKLILVLFTILFFSCDDSDSSSNLYYGIVECDESYTPPCYDDNDTTDTLGGCQAAIAALGCDFVYANTPLHELCPETCLVCDDDLYTNYTYNACYDGILSGRVLDSDNNPLANHEIILGYDFYNSDVGIGEGGGLDCLSMPTTTLIFVVPEDGEASLTIENKCGDIVKTIYDGFLNQNFNGYSFSFDWTDNNGKLLKPGLYFVKAIVDWIAYPSAESSSPLLFNPGNYYLCLNDDLEYNTNAMTDESGNFSIDIACEPFGFSFRRINHAGLVLDWEIIPFKASFNIYNSLGHVYSTDFISLENGHIDLVVP